MSLPVAPVRAIHPSLAQAWDARLLRTALACGVGLGVLDLVLEVTLPYPVADLANSSAVWALAALVLAAVARTTPARGALAGSVLLVVAVQAYDAAAVLSGMSDLRTMVSAPSLTWTVFGVLAGVVFGVAGSWLHGERPWHAAAGLAAGSSVFFAEAGVRLLHASALADLGTSLLTCALGVAVLMSSVARPVHLARAAASVVPFTLLGVLVFSLGGF